MVFQLFDQNSEKRKKKTKYKTFSQEDGIKVVVKGMKFSANIFFAMRKISSTAFPQWH